MWRVLELTVPGFDPTVPIQAPIWSDVEDIFHFAQAFLLFFAYKPRSLTTATFPRIFVYMVLQPAFTKTCKPGFEVLSHRVFDGSSTMNSHCHAAHSTETSPRFKGSQGIIGWAAMTTLVGPTGWATTTTLGAAAVRMLDIVTVAGTTTTTGAMGTPCFWMGLPLVGVVALPVAQAIWPAQIVINAPFCQMFNVQHLNGSDTSPNSVTC